MKEGKKVKFIGCSEDQHRWGSHTGDYKNLIIGKKYTVERIEVHSYHTKVWLMGIDGCFNSVCFK